MAAGKNQPSILDKLKRRGRDDKATRKVQGCVKEYLSGESSQGEGWHDGGEYVEKDTHMESSLEQRADPMSVALLSDLVLAQLKNVLEESVRCKQVCTDCKEEYGCINCTVKSTVLSECTYVNGQSEGNSACQNGLSATEAMTSPNQNLSRTQVKSKHT